MHGELANHGVQLPSKWMTIGVSNYRDMILFPQQLLFQLSSVLYQLLLSLGKNSLVQFFEIGTQDIPFLFFLLLYLFLRWSLPISLEIILYFVRLTLSKQQVFERIGQKQSEITQQIPHRIFFDHLVVCQILVLLVFQTLDQTNAQNRQFPYHLLYVYPNSRIFN